MWIVLRLLIAAVVFCYRVLPKRKPIAPDLLVDGVPVEIKSRGLASESKGVTLRVPFKTRLLFKITPERQSDRLFKSLGLASELQVGDETFDQNVYIACDQPFFREALVRNAGARELLQRVLDYGFTSIVADGHALAIRTSSLSPEAKESHAALLVALKKSLAEVENFVPSRITDPFTWRVLVVEAFVWSVLAYGLAGIPELFYDFGNQHLHGFDVLKTGIKFGGLMFLMLVPLIFLFMRGSSRGHRIIVESFLVLLIAWPLSGYQAVSDINRGMDRAPADEFVYQVADTREHVSRRRSRIRSGSGRYPRTSRTRRYSITLSEKPLSQPESPRVNPSVIPREIRVNYGTYADATRRKPIRLLIKPGRLGIPWFAEIIPE